MAAARGRPRHRLAEGRGRTGARARHRSRARSGATSGSARRSTWATCPDRSDPVVASGTCRARRCSCGRTTSPDSVGSTNRCSSARTSTWCGVRPRRACGCATSPQRSCGTRREATSAAGCVSACRTGRRPPGLDARHPGAAAPARLSLESAAVWASFVAGAPLVGAAVVVWTNIRLRRKVPAVPTIEAVRLGVEGHLSAGRQLARCSVRAWWPVTLVAAVRSRRARWLAAAGIVVSVLDARRDAQRIDLAADTSQPVGAAVPVGTAAPFDAVASSVLAVVDDLAYGAGLWRGCWRARSLRALLPTISRPT